MNNDKVLFTQSEARSIVTNQPLTEDVQTKVDFIVDRCIPRSRLNEYLDGKIEDSLFERTIGVRVPSAVTISTDRSVLDECHGNPYSVGVEQ